MLKSLTQDCVVAEKVEMMDSAAKRARGLLKYEEAPSSFAAIFKLPLFGFFPLVHCFGMKFPIDILFCNKEGLIKKVYRNIKPGGFVFPLRYAFGGCPIMIELSGCSPSSFNEGEKLHWSGETHEA
jgi:uncharacterized membrane protein (UPF0127 family)